MYKYAQTNIQLYRQIRSAGYSANSLRELSSAYTLASFLFSAQYRANGKPFVCHLVGTASILAAHNAPWPVVLAGLLHAAYAEGNFGSAWPKITHRQRKLVRDVIGGDADQLVEAYTAFMWNADVAERLVQEIHGLDEVPRSVVLMRIANELEEAITEDILFEPKIRRSGKARCLPYCSQLAEALGRQELAQEIIEVVQDISKSHVPDELITERSGSYLRPPLSHRARIGPFTLQGVKQVYHHSPRWLRTWLRALVSVRGE
jgi:(p)ppGpp synthase/HD superfamily hydrolase